MQETLLPCKKKKKKKTSNCQKLSATEESTLSAWILDMNRHDLSLQLSTVCHLAQLLLSACLWVCHSLNQSLLRNTGLAAISNTIQNWSQNISGNRLAKPTRQLKDHPAQSGYWAGLRHLGMTHGLDWVFIGWSSWVLSVPTGLNWYEWVVWIEIWPSQITTLCNKCNIVIIYCALSSL